MGAEFKLVFYAPDQATAIRASQAAYAEVDRLNLIFSDYDPHSEISLLSQGAPQTEPVPLSDPLWAVLSRSQQLAARSEGAFDVTIGPLGRLWRRARREHQLPAADRLEQARQSVGYQNLLLDPAQHTARLLRPKMLVDLGGIAMGYTVDAVLGGLQSQGITAALIDASGDIAAADPPPGKQGWTIGIAPRTAQGPPSRYVRLAHRAITTSGDAFQHVEVDGVRYSHILDPHTGLGLTDRSSVTVIADDCFTADSLDTTVSVLGPAKGLALVAETPGAEVLMLRVEGDRVAEYESPGFKQYEITPDATQTDPPNAQLPKR